MRLKKLLTVAACALFLSGCSQKYENTAETDLATVSETVAETNSEQNVETVTNTDFNADSEQKKDNVGSFDTTDIYGNEINQDIFKDYDLTLVNIFTTWCPPCVGELPELEKLYTDLGEEYNLNVIGIVLDSVDEDYKVIDSGLDAAKLLAEKTGITFPVLIPDETALNGILTEVYSVPETFFVDKDGNIVGEKYLGSGDYEMWTEIVESKLEDIEE